MTQSTSPSRPSGTSCSSAASGSSRRPPRSSRCTPPPPASWSARCRWPPRPTSTPHARPRARPSTRARGRTCRRRSGPRSSAPPSSCMEERADELKFLLAAETGQPQTIVDMMQYGAAMSAFQYYAGAADKFTWKDIRDGIYGQTLVRARADRRRRRRHRVERAVLPGRQQARPRPAGRLHRRAQARRRNPAVGVRDGRDVRRGRPARGRAVDRARRPRDRPRADRQPGARQVHVHRQLARSARRSPRSPPRSSSRARWSSAASPRRSSSRTPTWTPRCRCWCSPA